MNEKVVCCNCGNHFMPSPRHKNQVYCMKPKCRKAIRADRQKWKIETDEEYNKNQKISNQNWIAKTPGYWTEYRRKNPKKAERNRLLQRVRNKRARNPQENVKMDSSELIAKMYASTSYNYDISGPYWLIPLIAKMDTLKVNILTISDN